MDGEALAGQPENPTSTRASATKTKSGVAACRQVSFTIGRPDMVDAMIHHTSADNLLTSGYWSDWVPRWSTKVVTLVIPIRYPFPGIACHV